MQQQNVFGWVGCEVKVGGWRRGAWEWERGRGRKGVGKGRKVREWVDNQLRVASKHLSSQ
jgi:hypothetical protein